MEIIKRGAPQYKANLHCHSTLSDGKLTPDELKAAYKENGYSVLAITDHDTATAYPELTEKLDYIKKIISIEEEKFNATIDSGLAILSDLTEKAIQAVKELAGSENLIELANYLANRSY